MAHRYKRAEICDAAVYDPLPEDLVFDAVPIDHKASDLVLGLMRVAHIAKLIPRGTLTRVHLSFTSDLRLRQWASGNGRPFLDNDSKAIICDSTVLHGTVDKLPVSSYTTETILQDESFREWFFGLFGIPQDKPSAVIGPAFPGVSSPFVSPPIADPLSAFTSSAAWPLTGIRAQTHFTPERQIRHITRSTYNAFFDNIKANVAHIRALDSETDRAYTNWLSRDLQTLVDEIIEQPGRETTLRQKCSLEPAETAPVVTQKTTPRKPQHHAYQPILQSPLEPPELSQQIVTNTPTRADPTFRQHTRAYRPLITPDHEAPATTPADNPMREQLRLAAAEKSQVLARMISEEENMETE